MIEDMERKSFYAKVTCDGDNLVVNTKIFMINYDLIYREKEKRWSIHRLSEKDKTPEEALPFYKSSHCLVKQC